MNASTVKLHRAELKGINGGKQVVNKIPAKQTKQNENNIKERKGL